MPLLIVTTASDMKIRDSNLELFRIVTMLGIVLYHAALYSGLAEAAYADPWSLRSAAILWLGAWGKTGINCFVLITGYFMCERRLTIKRMAKLIGLTEFYAFLVYGLKISAGGGGFLGWAFERRPAHLSLVWAVPSCRRSLFLCYWCRY